MIFLFVSQALHFHVIIWGGCSPRLLQNAAGSESLTGLVRGALDEMFRGEVERHHHIRRLILSQVPRIDRHRLKGPEPALLLDDVLSKVRTRPPRIDVSSGVTMLKEYADSVAVMKGNHRHSFTCKKPPDGHIGCRLCRPLATRGSTCPVFLCRDEVSGSVNAMEQIASPELATSECDLRPGSGDSRIIVWELRRQELDDVSNTDAIDDLSRFLAGEGSKESGKKAKGVLIGHLKESLGPHCCSDLLEWLKGRGDSEILSLSQIIRNELPKANGNIVDFNPVSATKLLSIYHARWLQAPIAMLLIALR